MATAIMQIAKRVRKMQMRAVLMVACMKDMSRIQQGMAFYGQMPDMYAVVLNSDHELIKKVLENSKTEIGESLKPIYAELKGLNARKSVLRQQQGNKKPEEITQEEKDNMKTCERIEK